MPGQIALDVGHEHRHAVRREALGQHLERDRLAGAGGAGDQAVAVGETELEQLRRVSLADQNARHQPVPSLALDHCWRSVCRFCRRGQLGSVGRDLRQYRRDARNDRLAARSGPPSGMGPTMKFFVDTADVAEISELAATGLLDGVTTNPSLVAKIGAQLLRGDRGDLRAGRRPGQRRGHRDDLRSHAGRGPPARRARAQRLRQAAADLGRAEGVPDAHRRRHPGQRHLVLLAGPGAARGQGRRHLRVAVRRPPRRHRATTAWR